MKIDYYKEIKESLKYEIYWNSYYMNEKDTIKYIEKRIMEHTIYCLELEIINFDKDYEQYKIITNRYKKINNTEKNTRKMIEEIKKFTYYKNSI